jgi:hypothetical protein
MIDGYSIPNFLICGLRSSGSSRSKLKAKTSTSGYFLEKETISGISLMHGGHQSAQ